MLKGKQKREVKNNSKLWVKKREENNEVTIKRQ